MHARSYDDRVWVISIEHNYIWACMDTFFHTHPINYDKLTDIIAASKFRGHKLHTGNQIIAFLRENQSVNFSWLSVYRLLNVFFIHVFRKFSRHLNLLSPFKRAFFGSWATVSTRFSHFCGISLPRSYLLTSTHFARVVRSAFERLSGPQKIDRDTRATKSRSRIVLWHSKMLSLGGD